MSLFEALNPEPYDRQYSDRQLFRRIGDFFRPQAGRLTAVLILDDATSAIDSATEDRIQRAIAAAARGRTTLIITHRLSQIRWADLIIVLRKGRIAAMGRHEELMKSSEAYARIFRE